MAMRPILTILPNWTLVRPNISHIVIDTYMVDRRYGYFFNVYSTCPVDTSKKDLSGLDFTVSRVGDVQPRPIRKIPPSFAL